MDGSFKRSDLITNLVAEQEKKYKNKLSPHSNYYQRHVMVQQFFQTQLKTQPSQTRRDLSMTIARGFGRGQTTARNIVQWKTSWVDEQNIPERKKRQDYFS